MEHKYGGRFAFACGIVSIVAMGLALVSAVAVVALRIIHCFSSSLVPWTFKSAIPLILIGVAFAAFQFVAWRTRREIFLGLTVAAAFILWGAEQYVTAKAMASLMDDLVVFIFVIDLGTVISGKLKFETSGCHSASGGGEGKPAR